MGAPLTVQENQNIRSCDVGAEKNDGVEEAVSVKIPGKKCRSNCQRQDLAVGGQSEGWSDWKEGRRTFRNGGWQKERRQHQR